MLFLAQLRESGDIKKAEEIEVLLMEYDKPTGSERKQEPMKTVKPAEQGMVEEAMATAAKVRGFCVCVCVCVCDFTSSLSVCLPLSVADLLLLACQLMEQGKEKEAQELLAVLEWVAASEEAPKAAAAPAPQASAGPPAAKTFTPAQALQIEEATALMHQVRRSRALLRLATLLTACRCRCERMACTTRPTISKQC